MDNMHKLYRRVMPDGRHMETFIFDSMTSVVEVIDDLYEGECLRYFDTEKTKLQGKYNFRGGVLNGYFEEYDHRSNVLVNGHFLDGELDGVITSFFGGGDNVVTAKIEYSCGVLNGSFKKYYYNGFKSLDVTYKNGLKHGLSTSYYSNGKVYENLTYKEGYLDGECRYYNFDNKLVNTYLYKNYDGVEIGYSSTTKKVMFDTIDSEDDLEDYIDYFGFNKVGRNNKIIDIVNSKKHFIIFLKFMNELNIKIKF